MNKPQTRLEFTFDGYNRLVEVFGVSITGFCTLHQSTNIITCKTNNLAPLNETFYKLFIKSSGQVRKKTVTLYGR